MIQQTSGCSFDFTRRSLPALGWAFFYVSVVSACASTPRPESTLEAFVAASERGDYAAAQAMLSENARQSTTEDDLRAQVEDNPEESSARMAALRESEAQAQAIVTDDSGQRVAVVLDEDGWRVSGEVLGTAPYQRPQDTLRAFHHALDRGDLDGILRVFSRERRAEILLMMEALATSTEDPSVLPVVIEGDRAVLRHGRTRFVLVRESGQWRISEIRND